MPQTPQNPLQPPQMINGGVNPDFARQNAPTAPQLNAAGFVVPGTGSNTAVDWANQEMNRFATQRFSGAGAPQGAAIAAWSQAEEADRQNRAPEDATFNTDLQRRIDEFYNEATRSLNPEWERRAREFDQSLVGRGIDPNSEAGIRAREDFTRSRNDAFNSARNQATQFGAGLQNQREQQRMQQAALDQQRYAALAAGAAAGTGFNPQALQIQRDEEDRRRWDAQFGLQRDQFGEDRRRFDMGFDFNSGRADMQDLMDLWGFERQGVGMNNQFGMQELNAILPFLGMIPQGGPAGIDVMSPYNLQMQGNMANAQQAQNAQNGRNQMFGQILQTLPFMFSDERVKEGVRQVGTLHNGLPVYAYRYKHGGPTHIGVMAQDVEKVKPDAVIEVAGVKMVNYDLAVA